MPLPDYCNYNQIKQLEAEDKSNWNLEEDS